MDQSSSPSKASIPPIFSPWILSAVVGVVAYVASTQAPLQTERPKADKETKEPQPPSVAEIHATHARLWEDPLLAPHATDASKCDEGFRKLGAKPYKERLQEHFDKLCNLHHALTVMAVLVPGEPYAEQREERIRTRYAVLSGLGRCGYDLQLPTRMSCVEVPIKIGFSIVGADALDNVLIVPVKLHQRTSPGASKKDSQSSDYILTLWINETQLGDRPLWAVSQVLEALFSVASRRKMRLSVVGPSSSDQLSAMIREDGKAVSPADKEAFSKTKEVIGSFLEEDFGASNETKKGAILYSPRATVSNEDPRKKHFSCGLTLVRAIGSDDMLVEALSKEMRLRNAWPILDDEEVNPKRHVLLIYERDTLYGRSLHESMEQTFEDLERLVGQKNLHAFTYLRGIDGMLPGDPSSDRREPKKAEQPVPQDSPEDRLPEGGKQYDYLRRLGAQIEQLNRELRRNGGEITAIGVVGTDFYDKLLVLRAIRARFPRACFFTTDLDAGYCHPREYRYTRNLVVASHFGLRLGPELQGDVPCFRDGYQTATFFAVLMAFCQDQCEAWKDLVRDNPWGLAAEPHGHQYVQPLLYEIGANGPFQLTHPEAGSLNGSVHPRNPNQDTFVRPWLLSVGLLLFLVCVSLYEHHMRAFLLSLCGLFSAPFCPGRRHDRGGPIAVIVVLVVTGILVWLAVADDRSGNGEHFGLLDGISTWPSTFLRYLALLVSVWILATSFFQLHENLGQLGAYFLETPAVNRELRQNRKDRRMPKDRRGLPSLRWLLWGRWPCYDLFKTRGLLAARPSVRRIFRQYESVEAWSRRSLRVAIASITCFFFVFLLFVAIGEWPNSPYRGDRAWWVGKTFSYLSGFAIMLLVFQVLDATHFCRRFVRRIAETTGRWPAQGILKMRETVGETTRESTIPDEDLKELFIIRIIAKRTKMVGKLIYWPFIVLLLMFLARHPSLGHWSYPWALLLAYALILLGAVYAAWELRKDSQEARDTVLRRLRDRLLGLTGAREAQTKFIIQQIEQEQDGAFGPLSSNPILNALAVPIGGVSVIAILEQAAHWFQ